MRSVTILIPCRDEAAVIEAKVRHCAALDAGCAAEVIVVDDHSTDATAARARARAAGARVVRSQRAPGKWGAVMAGADVASGEVVCITDADALMERHALTRALKCFDDPGVGAVCGLRTMARRMTGGRIERCDGLYDLVRKTMIVFYSLLDSSPALCGPMMLVRRDVLRQLDCGRLRADDVDAPVQVRKLGLKAKACASARFIEWEVRGRAQREQGQRRALGLAQAYWHHRDALFNPRLGLFGLVAYPMEFAFFFLLPLVTLAACATAVACAVAGSGWGWAACGAVCVEEFAAWVRRVPGAIVRNIEMLRAIASYVWDADAVASLWQPPPREV